MNIFLETDYRTVLSTSVKELKKVDPSATFQKMATAMRVQKAYLTNILKGRAQVSSDQMYLACKFLRLNQEQTSYMDLLLEYSKTQLAERRASLLGQLKQLQEKHTESKEYISNKVIAPAERALDEYYIDPWHQIVHVCLSIEAFHKDPSLLAKVLRLSPERLGAIILKLEQLGVIEKSRGGYVVKIRNIHLPRAHPMYQPWRDRLKLLSLFQLQESPDPQTLSYANVFSADEEARKAIHLRLLSLLKELEPLVKKAPAKDVFHLNIDLFRWTRRPD